MESMNLESDGGRLIKMEVDYTETCEEKIAECKRMAAEGKLHDALDTLLAFEKQTRTAGDVFSTREVLVAIVQICFEAKNWVALNEQIVLLSKRRSQLKQAVTKMVRECCDYVDKMPTKDTQLKLIETLRTVTEGKIYVEVERARLTHKLAKMKEVEGDINEAANIMQELQIETYGSMEKREKVELILEQMRLCLAKKDYIRTQIISKKINTKFFEEPDTQQLKLKFFKLMILVDQHEGQYLATCRHYRALLATPVVQEDKDQCQEVLQNVVLHLILAPYDNEQADLSHRVLEDPLLNKLPQYKELLRLFINPELIKWSGLCDVYEKLLKNGTDEIRPTTVFQANTEMGDKRWKTLRSRVVQHNIRIMAKYYTRITLQRMSELLDMSIEETEETLSEMVTSKSVQAKTDRPAGIVVFKAAQQPNDVLNDWASNLTDLMRLLNNTTHLINKEHMIHKHLQQANY
ncbi:26S proteasome [Nesidiocoris tenuis]|uniref:26S proteasome n=1 Tax=Nesidiocoris tenuis TaxID=355587 RepID=A0ABN7BDF6_9HEMI|nr:26S proteasome [Nesidiocoris tenuis]